MILLFSFFLALFSKESFDQLFRDWRKSKKLVDQKTVLLKSLEAEQKPDVMRITSLKDELEEVKLSFLVALVSGSSFNLILILAKFPMRC